MRSYFRVGGGSKLPPQVFSASVPDFRTTGVRCLWESEGSWTTVIITECFVIGKVCPCLQRDGGDVTTHISRQQK